MRLPTKYQIFDREVILTSKDAERLEVHLANWRVLHEVMLLGVCLEDLRRLVILELAGNARRTILVRLLGRIAKLQRNEVMAKIDRLLE